MEDPLAVFGVETAPVTALVPKTADACPAAPALPIWASASLSEFRLDSMVTLIRDAGCA